jgi:hypothetical protein
MAMKILLTFCVIVFFSCKTSSTPEAKSAPELYKEWKISHEEASGDTVVLRPAGFDFPPARLREEFIFHKDHTLTYKTLDAVDLPLIQKGSWEWEDGNTLKITIDGDRILLWEVVTLNDRKLKVSVRQVN